MNKEFAQFQKYFQDYQKRFGLTGYKVYFKYEPIDHCYANITVNQSDMVVTVRLNSNLTHNEIPFRDVKQSAKHEAIHLLLFRLEDRAINRYITENELYEAAEELVFKLEGLIND